MKVDDFSFALEKMREVQSATRKLSAYVSMIGEKDRMGSVSMNIAIEVLRRAALDAAMNSIDPNSKEGKKYIEDINELADLFLDQCKSNIRIRSKDHSYLPDWPTEIDLR